MGKYLRLKHYFNIMYDPALFILLKNICFAKIILLRKRALRRLHFIGLMFLGKLVLGTF